MFGPCSSLAADIDDQRGTEEQGDRYQESDQEFHKTTSASKVVIVNIIRFYTKVV